MDTILAMGLLIPFLGTSLGAATCLFMTGELHREVQRGLTGFAAGVMVAKNRNHWEKWLSSLQPSVLPWAWFFCFSWTM